MKGIVPGLLLMVVATLQPRPAAAQDPNDPLLNMQAIAQALGVQCAYCHVRQTDNSTDFQADTNPKKDIARQMIAMTREINARVQAASGKAAGQAASVHCLTCHRGTPVPQKLTDIVLRTLRDKGPDAAVAEYKELRQKFYARDTYDFSETDLLNLAQRLADAQTRRCDRADDDEPGVQPEVRAELYRPVSRVRPETRHRHGHRAAEKGARDRTGEWNRERVPVAAGTKPKSPLAQVRRTRWRNTPPRSVWSVSG